MVHLKYVMRSKAMKAIFPRCLGSPLCSLLHGICDVLHSIKSLQLNFEKLDERPTFPLQFIEYPTSSSSISISTLPRITQVHVTQGCFFNTFEKNSRRKKPKCFGLRPKTQGQFFQKPQACGIFKHMIFFSNNTQTDFKLKGLFYCIFCPK